jgi:hypothetical protein
MKPTPRQELDAFLAKYTPEIEALARKVLAKMRTRLPGAVELVYDNYNALAIGFGPTDRSSDAVFSIAVFPRWVSLFFLQGAKLKDPDGFLSGKGNQVRHIVLADASTLDRAPVKALMRQALANAPPSLHKKSPRRILIKSISAKQRPRRPVKRV